MGNACGPKKGIAENIMLELEVSPIHVLALSRPRDVHSRGVGTILGLASGYEFHLQRYV